MGNRFEFTVLGPDEKWCAEKSSLPSKKSDALKNCLQLFQPTASHMKSMKMQVIRPVKVTDEVFSLIQRCQMLSKITQGAFDISYGGIDKKFWNFDLNMTSFSDAETAKKSVALINYENIMLDESEKTVFLKEKGCASDLAVSEKAMPQKWPNENSSQTVWKAGL